MNDEYRGEWLLRTNKGDINVRPVVDWRGY
jgi:hypothetical protein